MMNREAWGILGDADLICYLIDGSKGWHAEDGEYVASILQTSAAPILLLVTKADAAKSFVIDRNSDVILGKIQEICGDDPAKKSRFLTPMPYLLSAKRPEEINEFRAYLAEFMPEGPFLYDPENLTDRPETFVIAEMIREQVFRHLGEELPYETSVVVESLEPGPTTRVAAMIIVGRESHKPIVIGQGGRTIKAIGTAARQTLERHFDGRVFLELFVRVQTNWINDPSLVSELQSLDL
jgi:GTP-binding protein Era